MTSFASGAGGLTGGDAGPDAVNGLTASADAAAVAGVNTGNGASGGIGTSNAPFGHQPVGVMGRSDSSGVVGLSNTASGVGVYGGSVGGGGTGVMGESTAGTAVRGKSNGTGFAGEFIGTVHVSGDLAVTGDIFIENGGDLAERFPLAAGSTCAAGMVMCVDDDGALAACASGYDPRVVGVVPGDGSRSSAVTFRDELRATSNAPIALIGTVYCWADAAHGPIRAGDLLTSSPTLGHAMRAGDPRRGFGSIIGKALQPLPRGRASILILVHAR